MRLKTTTAMGIQPQQSIADASHKTGKAPDLLSDAQFMNNNFV